MRERYVYPLCAAIWSASLDTARRFPAEHFARFFANHGLLSLADRPQWRTVPGGSQAYIDAMRPTLDADIRLNTPALAVRRENGGVTVDIETGAARFDAVIFACHSDQALALLGADASPAEREILGALPYVDNDVILHTDRRLLPQRPRAWASWNYALHEDRTHAATLTYAMNRLQGLEAPVEFCVTLNAREAIDPATILGEYVYAHPVYTPESNAARARRAEINGGEPQLVHGRLLVQRLSRGWRAQRAGRGAGPGRWLVGECGPGVRRWPLSRAGTRAWARGFVVHRRFTPRAHRFRYGLSMLLVDLDEGPRLFRKRLAVVLEPAQLRRDPAPGPPAPWRRRLGRGGSRAGAHAQRSAPAGPDFRC